MKLSLIVFVAACAFGSTLAAAQTAAHLPTLDDIMATCHASADAVAQDDWSQREQLRADQQTIAELRRQIDDLVKKSTP